MRTISAAFLVGALAVAALAQTTRYGDPNFVRQDDWRSGWPEILTIDVSDVGGFDGTSAEIPFTLEGSGATVWLAVYTRGADPQYNGAPFGAGGPGDALLRAAGLDTMVYVSPGQDFSEGPNTIIWDGTDWTGKAMPAGDYDYFLFALDRQANPTWVGQSHGPWLTNRIDTRYEPPEIWWPDQDGAPVVQSDGSEEDGWAIHRSIMGTDWLENPEGFETFDIPWMNERLGRDTDWRDIGAYALDPAVRDVGYIVMMDADPGGLWRVIYDRENGAVVPDETSWPESDRGFIPFSSRQYNIAIKNDFHHPWIEDDGLLYFSWEDKIEPMTPAVVKVDRATGEIVEIMDYSDFYLAEYVDSDGNPATYTPGPSGIDVDESGIYTSGHWMVTGPEVFGVPPFDLPSYPLKRTFDGDIIWMNRNGDGVIDRYQGDEAAALGIDPMDQLVNVDCKVTRWGITFYSGYNNPQWAECLGPDGAGLFSVMVDRMDNELGGEVWWMDNGTNLDGLYIAHGEYLVHWPFDAGKGLITAGEVTAVTEVAGQTLPRTAALEANYPNPFNAETTVKFAIPQTGELQHATLTVFTMNGQRVCELVDDDLHAGVYQATWDGLDSHGYNVGSGVYLYTLDVDGQRIDSRRMTLLK